MEEGLARVDFDRCMGCGVCVTKCEQEAMTLRREPAKGEPLDIVALQVGEE
jgi:Pyruvate/2-oxoacid:ferredoxin oxidoreductase delta subunit